MDTPQITRGRWYAVVATACMAVAAVSACGSGSSSTKAPVAAAGGSGSPAAVSGGPVVRVVDPAPAKDARDKASTGWRYVAVQLRFRNAGTTSYDDAPSNDVTLLDGQGQQFRAAVEDTSAGPGFGGTVTLAPGASALGSVTFELPAASKPAKFKVTLDSNVATDVGVWLLAYPDDRHRCLDARGTSMNAYELGRYSIWYPRVCQR